MGERARGPRRWRPHLWLVKAISLIVPRPLRRDWRREWESELQHRESRLAAWRRLTPRARIDLLGRSAGAFWDALWLQPRRLEDEMFQDLRFGARMLARDRGFTLVAVATLALGVGAATAVFSVVNALLVRPLPYHEPDRVVAILERGPRGRAQITPANFLDWRAQQRVFEHLAAYHVGQANLTGGAGEPQRVRRSVVSASFFDALGARPILGRAFLPEEELPGHDPVAVISYGLWQGRFGGDPGVVGRAVTIDGRPYTVVGVMAAGVRFPNDTEIWRPPQQFVPEADVDMGDVTQIRGLGFLGAVARLAPGVTLEQARAEMEVVTDRLRQQYPETNNNRFNDVVPLRESLVGDLRPGLLLLSGAVACVLLIACANVANLLLARGAARRREIAVRAALGAGRPRVIRQLLTESLLLALLGGALGLALAVSSVGAIARLAQGMIPPGIDLGVDWRVLAFALAASTLTGLFFGLVPALQVSGVDLGEALKDAARGTAGGRRARLLRAFVVAEMALCLALLAGAGLLSRSFLHLQAVPLGFDADRVLTARLAPTGEAYDGDRQRAQFYRDVLRRVESLPGVEAAGAIDALPLGPGPVNGYLVEGRPPLRPDQMPGANRRLVSPGYFRAMGVPLLRGRAFTERDDEDAPGVVVVNEAFAAREFPGEDPLGKRVSFSVRNGERVWLEIVGLAADVRNEAVAVEPKPEAYLPFPQMSTAGLTLVVRASGDAASLAGGVREVVRAVDANQPLSEVRTMDEVVAASLSRPSFSATLLGVFALLALLMAAAGVYGVMSYMVGQRTAEIGVRLALGASPRQVVRMIVAQGARVVVLGLAVGLAAALLLSRLLAGLLYGVTPGDPPTLLAVVAVLAGVALLASYIPARRAAAVDPAVTLRGQ